MKSNIFFILVPILIGTIGCINHKNDQINQIKSIKSASVDSDYFKIINDVLRINFQDSVKSITCYHKVYIRTPKNTHYVDTNEIVVDVKTVLDDNFQFTFYKYAKSYSDISKNGRVVYVNKEFPKLPDPYQLVFD